METYTTRMKWTNLGATPNDGAMVICSGGGGGRDVGLWKIEFCANVSGQGNGPAFAAEINCKNLEYGNCLGMQTRCMHRGVYI